MDEEMFYEAMKATEEIEGKFEGEIEEDIKEIIDKIEKGNSEKTKYDFKIYNIPHRLNYVSDRHLKLAIELLSIGKFFIKNEVIKGQEKIKINNNIISLCDKKSNEYTVNELLNNNPNLVVSDKVSSYTVANSAENGLFYGKVCEGCLFEKCPKAIAGLILYLYNTDQLVDALRERKIFREKNKEISPYFDFVLNNKIGIKEMSDLEYDFCCELIKRNIVRIENVLDKDGFVVYKSKINCSEFAIINNDIAKIPDVSDKNFTSLKRNINFDTGLCQTYTCRLSFCPTVACGYMYYMIKSGRENELEEERKYYHENKNEIDEVIKNKVNEKNKELENKAQGKLVSFEKFKNCISNIDSLLTTLVSKKQNSMHIMITSNDINETTEFIKCIIETLKNDGKIKGIREYSLQQFYRLYSHESKEMIEDDDSRRSRFLAKKEGREIPPPYAKRDENGIQFLGDNLMYYNCFEKGYLYILDNVSELLRDYEISKTNTNFFKVRKQIEHIIKVLTSMNNYEYIIITGTSDEIERLLNLDQRLNFIYKESIYKISELSNNQLFDLYIKGLDTSLLESYRGHEQEVRASFDEYISFARKSMPFDSRGLVNYLDVYANSRGKIEFPQNIYKKESLDESLKNIVGLDSVKEKVKEFEKYMMFQIKAKTNGIELKSTNMHMIFTGNPGTGKTTIARIMAKMLYDLGLIEENKLIEVERKDLVGQYNGQTAIKTSEVIQSAMGGVLFVDEAYTLASDKGSNNFGAEAIATLIKAMEDHKDKLVVIFAGYKNEMKSFLDTNPGISSRIGYTFNFEDYSSEELMKIFEVKTKNMGFLLNDNIYVDLKRICDYFSKKKDFGNGRFVDKLIQETIMNHSLNLKDEEINIISREDIPSIEVLNNERIINNGKTASDELDELIGINNIKKEMRDFEAYVKFVKRAEENGLNIPSSNLHMIFAGNPGTGKTTVARIIAKLLFEIGIIHENKLIEVERKDLVGEYIGHTAPKTNEVIERALGGVLFIDEAYTLANGHNSGHDFGAEAVATLIKAMEDHKSEFVVIFAGYTKEMRQFLDINPGIASRVGYTFNFEDYSADELDKIFELKVSKAKLRLEDGVMEKVHKINNYFHNVEDFGNGRFVDKIFAKVLLNHSKNENAEIDLITNEDIPDVNTISSSMLDGSNMVDPDKITDEERMKTAIHETGHATIRYLLFNDPQIVKITILAEGTGALGYVQYKGNSSSNVVSKEWYYNRITGLLGGMTAEQVFIGYNENGCGSDLRKATHFAQDMVTRFGMSSLGFSVIEKPGAEVEKLVFIEVNNILNECYEKAKELITNNKEKMQKVVDYLFEHNEITEEEFIREFNK